MDGGSTSGAGIPDVLHVHLIYICVTLSICYVFVEYVASLHLEGVCLLRMHWLALDVKNNKRHRRERWLGKDSRAAETAQLEIYKVLKISA